MNHPILTMFFARMLRKNLERHELREVTRRMTRHRRTEKRKEKVMLAKLENLMLNF
jgi:hypothetical protein